MPGLLSISALSLNISHSCHAAEYDMGGAAIDFGGVASAIKVQNGGSLEFDSITLSNPANPRWTNINDTYLVNIAFAALRSIDTEPNATVSSAK